MNRCLLALGFFGFAACLTSTQACGVTTGTEGDLGGSGGTPGAAGTSNGYQPLACSALAGSDGSGGALGSCVPGGFCDLLSEAQFNQLFPNARPPYSYAGLVAAADTYYPLFTRTGDLAARKREAAAFLANVAHESGGFQYAEELICANGAWMTNPDCSVYISNGISYHGRGAIQLSYLSNYRAASRALCADLVANPDQVATNPELAMGTAIWFWMQGGRCHQIITNNGGFGATVNAINGIECSSMDPVRIGQWNDRLALFTSITAAMGIPVGDTSGCR